MRLPDATDHSRAMFLVFFFFLFFFFCLSGDGAGEKMGHEPLKSS